MIERAIDEKQLIFNGVYGAMDKPLPVSPVVDLALRMDAPRGTALELASGFSGNALALALSGYDVTVVDISDVALDKLCDRARRADIADRIHPVLADVKQFELEAGRFSFVFCGYFYQAELFTRCSRAVAPAGLIGWEAVVSVQQNGGMHPQLPWFVRTGEPANLLPAHFNVLLEQDVVGERSPVHVHGAAHTLRRLLAKHARRPERQGRA